MIPSNLGICQNKISHSLKEHNQTQDPGIIRLTKNQEYMTHSQEKNRSIETDGGDDRIANVYELN